MKRWIGISALAAALLLVGCSDKTKEQVKEAAQSVQADATTAAKEAGTQASDAMAEAKRAAAEALERAKEQASATAAQAAETAQRKAAELQEAAKAQAAAAAAAVEKKAAELKAQMTAPSGSAQNGAALFAKCAGCHGANGKTPALGKSPAIAGQDAAKLREFLMEYQAGKRNAYGMGTLMQSQVKGLSPDEISALAEYISKL